MLQLLATKSLFCIFNLPSNIRAVRFVKLKPVKVADNAVCLTTRQYLNRVKRQNKQ